MDLGSVLIIEDDPDVATVLELTLRRMGARRTTVASDGREELELALAGIDQLMLVDLLLPGKDGYDLVLEYRSQRAPAGRPAPDLPVIVFVTSAARSVGAELVERSGADGLICKPFTMAGLSSRLQEIFAARQR